MRRIAMFLSALALPLGLSAPAAADVGRRPVEPWAGTWRSLVLTSGVEVGVAAPPRNHSAETRAELAELHALQAARMEETHAVIDRWNADPVFEPWTLRHLQLIVDRGSNTPQAHRGLALLHAAIYDTVIASWHAKYRYRRPAPSQLDKTLMPSVKRPLHPSYPSEHAAIAWAAAEILAYLYPGDATALRAEAAQASESRLHAGVNYRSDVEAGTTIGRGVAQRVIDRRALTDGSSAVWDCVAQPGRRHGPGFWEPTSPPSDPCARPPTEPLAGEWKTWIIPSGAAFLAPEPPSFVVYGTTLEAVCEVHEDAARQLMAEVALTRAEGGVGPRNDLINRWAGPPLNRWNLIALELIDNHDLTDPRAARVAVYVNLAGADGLTASWASKFEFWTWRPQQAIRQCGLDPAFTSVRSTPRDPSYTSGLSTVSGAVSKVLAYFFPNNAGALRADAAGAMQSRLYDGTHWRHDNEAGFRIGTSIARRNLDRARADGATPARQKGRCRFAGSRHRILRTQELPHSSAGRCRQRR
jgi:membrane-associated phospholipid phosphatase